jgi:hypothetical protein
VGPGLGLGLGTGVGVGVGTGVGVGVGVLAGVAEGLGTGVAATAVGAGVGGPAATAAGWPVTIGSWLGVVPAVGVGLVPAPCPPLAGLLAAERAAELPAWPPGAWEDSPE